MNKIKKNTLILTKLEKVAFNLMMNITKMGKPIKSTKFRIIFDKILIKAKIFINFSDLRVFPIFVIFIFKLNANFPGLQPKSEYFFNFTTLILAISQKFDK